jgi:hypothetical protein
VAEIIKFAGSGETEISSSVKGRGLSTAILHSTHQCRGSITGLIQRIIWQL